jgi:hypothetical protein
VKVEQPATEPTELPACPFNAGDVIQHCDPDTSKTKWKITHIKDGKLLVTSHDPYQTPSWIELQFWCNYRAIDPIDGTAVDAPPQQCPFVVGDVIRSIKFPQYVFHVTEINSDDIVAYNREACSNHVIPRAKWEGYEVKSLISVDKPNQTC